MQFASANIINKLNQTNWIAAFTIAKSIWIVVANGNVQPNRYFNLILLHCIASYKLPTSFCRSHVVFGENTNRIAHCKHNAQRRIKFIDLFVPLWRCELTIGCNNCRNWTYLTYIVCNWTKTIAMIYRCHLAFFFIQHSIRAIDFRLYIQKGNFQFENLQFKASVKEKS